MSTCNKEQLLFPSLVPAQYQEDATKLLSLTSQAMQPLSSVPGSKIVDSTLHGSTAEEVSGLINPYDYQRVKDEQGQTSPASPKTAEILRGNKVYDPDVDICVWNRKIPMISVYAELMNTLRNHSVDTFWYTESVENEEYLMGTQLSDTSLVIARMAPLSTRVPKTRIHIQQVDISTGQNMNVFHEDITAPSAYAERNEGRIRNNGIADIVQNPLIATNNGFQVLPNKRASYLEVPANLLRVNLSRSDYSVLVATTRNARKLASAKSCNTSFNDMCPVSLADQATIDRIHRIADNPRGLIETCTQSEIIALSRELYVMGGWNARLAWLFMIETKLGEILSGEKIKNLNFANSFPCETQINQFLGNLSQANIELETLASKCTT